MPFRSAACVALLLAILAVPASAQPRAQSIPEADAETLGLLQRLAGATNPADAKAAGAALRQRAKSSPAAALACGMLAGTSNSFVGDDGVRRACLRSAADAGVADAQFRLAIVLLDSPGASEADRLEAERLLRASAASLPESVYRLALHQASSAPDAERARRDVIERAAKAGYATAQRDLARTLTMQGNEREAVDWLAKAADQGDPVAARSLAEMLDRRGDPADRARAMTLLAKAADGGDVPAAYEYGRRLALATGPDRDTERGLAYLRHAAGAGHVEAQYALGYMLGQGIGTGSDEAAAVEWFRLAAARGHAAAMYALGNSYANGWGVGKSLDLADQWYCRAARAGSEAGRTMFRGRESACSGLPRP